MSTIGVQEVTLIKVKKIAKQHKISNGEFVELAAQFFLKTGIDIKEGYSIKSDLQEQNKRLNQVIAWTRTQEKEHLIPIFTELRKNNVLTRSYLEELDTLKMKETIRYLTVELQKIQQIEQSKVKLFDNIRLGFERQTNRLEKRNTLLTRLVNLERNITGGVKDKTQEASLRSELNSL